MIGRNYGSSYRDALDDPSVQALLRILNHAFGEAFLHECGESKAHDFYATFVVHFYKGASRCMTHFKKLLPGFHGLEMPHKLLAYLGGVKLQAFWKVSCLSLTPGKQGGHGHT